MTPWLSPSGLLADMVGVIIITYDIWPEYRLHRLREAIEWQHKVLLSNASEKIRTDDTGNLVQGMLHGMNQNEIDRLRNKIKLPHITGGRRTPTYTEIERSIIETNGMLDKRIDAAKTEAVHQLFWAFCLSSSDFSYRYSAHCL